MTNDKKAAAQQESNKPYQIPRGSAATVAKNKYRDKNYDRAELALPKGMKVAVKKIADQQGQSFNEYVTVAIKEKAERDTGQELTLQKED